MIYLIPTLLAEDATETIPPYVMKSVEKCQVFYAENLRTARRFLKKMNPAIVIDNFHWHEMGKDERAVESSFRQDIKSKCIIGIMSEAGCPGVADPGQKLVQIAQQMGETIKPLVGPSSILLALMASGMNGQQFTFKGYLPVKKEERVRALRKLEERSERENSTQIFIETPYRNETLFQDILETCHPETLLCIACEITGPDEWIITRSVSQWKKQQPGMHKKTAIFLLYKQKAHN